jgi:hypothetical protein
MITLPLSGGYFWRDCLKEYCSHVKATWVKALINVVSNSVGPTPGKKTEPPLDFEASSQDLHVIISVINWSEIWSEPLVQSDWN